MVAIESECDICGVHVAQSAQWIGYNDGDKRSGVVSRQPFLIVVVELDT